MDRGLVKLPTAAAIQTSCHPEATSMARNNRLAEGDWEQFWEEQPLDDWEERLSSQPAFDDEFEQDWEEQETYVYRCPRCGTKRLVDAEDYRLAEASDGCEDCMWETDGGGEEDSNDLLD